MAGALLVAAPRDLGTLCVTPGDWRPALPPRTLGPCVWRQVAGALLVAAPRDLETLVWHQVAGPCLLLPPKTLGP